MAAYPNANPALLVKKLGALLLTALGLLFIGLGFVGGYAVMTAIGIAMLLVGMLLLAFKIARRNQDI